MYKAFTAQDYKTHFKLSENYSIEGFVIYGTYTSYPYEILKEEITKLGFKASYTNLTEFLSPIMQFVVNGKTFWFVTAYGGAMLSEWVHLACLFGSKTNIVLGSCGGLYKEANTRDLIIPTYSFGDESTTRMYTAGQENEHYADAELSKRLSQVLSKEHKVFNGPVVTCQAMLAETLDDIQRWAKEGYYGVEMETATVFAISKHFNVPASAILKIGDNLIKGSSVLDEDYQATRDWRREVTHDIFAATLKELLST